MACGSCHWHLPVWIPVLPVEPHVLPSCVLSASTQLLVQRALPITCHTHSRAPCVHREFKNSTTMAELIMTSLRLPSSVELRACWELCRLHNNIGFWVVWLPTAWSIAMVYHAQQQLSAVDIMSRLAAYVPLCFGIKSLIMTIDDILDADIDALVERTKFRPIPRGAICPSLAWLFFSIQVLLAIFLAPLYLSRNALTVAMFAAPLYIIYPTCKRWMSFAPVPLGLMFNVGAFMGWADMSLARSVPWSKLLPVYLGAVCWTITYETIYQHEDKLDDHYIGIRSPALFLGHYTIPVTTVSAFSFFSLLAYGGYLNNHGVPFYVSLFCAALLLLPSLWQTDIDSPRQCHAFFSKTPFIGQIIFAGFLLDAVSYRVTHGLPL